MKAEPESPGITAKESRPSDGMIRVRRLCLYLKAMVLIYFVAFPSYIVVFSRLAGRGFGLGHVNGLTPGEKLIALVSSAIYISMAVIFYRLLNLFEKGIFFSPGSVRFLRLLGYLAFGNGLLGLVAPVAAGGGIAFPGILLAAVSSPWIMGGLFGIMISHIMDEGCKMREEQDLTV